MAVLQLPNLTVAIDGDEAIQLPSKVVINVELRNSCPTFESSWAR